MQFAIELSDELANQLLQYADIQNFVRRATEKMLLEESKFQAKQNLLALMAAIPKTVSLADELIQERRLEANKEHRGT